MKESFKIIVFKFCVDSSLENLHGQFLIVVDVVKFNTV